MECKVSAGSGRLGRLEFRHLNQAGGSSALVYQNFLYMYESEEICRNDITAAMQLKSSLGAAICSLVTESWRTGLSRCPLWRMFWLDMCTLGK